ncbi:MAG: hypothetical protein JW741_00035 [Sedimentisphaerales bacterium]|nr:hypothetical protein [Sedimentisphaerales bacterium]
MRSVSFVLLSVALLSLATGCGQSCHRFLRHKQPLIDGTCGHCTDCPETCQSCGCNESCCDATCGPDCGPNCGTDCGDCGQCERCCRLRGLCRQPINPGPPTGAVAYPYYTTRGPRDFLSSNPRSIGP